MDITEERGSTLIDQVVCLAHQRTVCLVSADQRVCEKICAAVLMTVPADIQLFVHAKSEFHTVQCICNQQMYDACVCSSSTGKNCAQAKLLSLENGRFKFTCFTHQRNFLLCFCMIYLQLLNTAQAAVICLLLGSFQPPL